MHNYVKKGVSVCLALALFGCVLTGCGDTAPESSTPVSGGDPTTQSTTPVSGGDPTTQSTTIGDNSNTTTDTTEGSTMTNTTESNTAGTTDTTKAPTKSTSKTSATTAKPSSTVTFEGKLDKAVTMKATFTGDSATPNFTAEQKSAQKKAGKALIEAIRLAARNPEISTFVIPAGNYGFEATNNVNGVNSGIVLMDIQRTEDNPFTIEAEGVTFWLEMIDKPCGSVIRGLHLVNCSNIRINNLTMDGYTPCAIEGEITSIDKAGNRIGFKPYAGTMELTDIIVERAIKGSEFRMVTVKANGDYPAPLYNINNQWGPESTWGANLEVKGDTAWFTLKTTTLMNTVFTDKWLSTYGKNGTVEVGDGICILYGTVLAACIDNCKQIQMNGLNCYITKGGFWENGGYGDHLWKDCYVGPRPGTNRLLGGEGNMSQGLRHGSTYDGVVYGLTTDDSINIHGFWSTIQTVAAAAGGGYTCTISNAPVGIQAGDKAELYTNSGKLVATLTVKEAPAAPKNYNGFTNPFTFVEQPPENYAQLKVRWPASECDGFVIRNCVFSNIYQRALVNSGSGVIENNLFLNHGSNLALNSNTGAYEGGVMKNIVIRNNVFCSTANHPGATTVDISQTTNWANYVSAENITLENNVFVQCGKVVSASNVKNLSVIGNLIVEPILYDKTLATFKDVAKISSSCSTKENGGNVVYSTSGATAAGKNALKSTTADKVAQAVAICNDDNLTVAKMLEKLRALFK
ncbi:MAG: hypothetical protein IJZ13_01235 [Clostridia bacterium]|nr:hypothetical protein [Clostridia bacterium]